MKEEDRERIVNWLKREIEPISDFDGNPEYPCAVILQDDTIMECAVIKSKEVKLHCAIGRVLDADLTEIDRTSEWTPLNKIDLIMEALVTNNNSINSYNIKSVFKSKFAIPQSIQQQITGETRMSWTQFTGEMDDGNKFNFGTSYHRTFFNMPSGYTSQNLKRIEMHKQIDNQKIYRERSFFEIFIEHLIDNPILDKRYKKRN